MEDETGFYAEASSLKLPVGIWPKYLDIDNRRFTRVAYGHTGANYTCEDGDKPGRVEVFND
jgi:hypothetical protein